MILIGVIVRLEGLGSLTGELGLVGGGLVLGEVTGETEASLKTSEFTGATEALALFFIFLLVCLN